MEERLKLIYKIKIRKKVVSNLLFLIYRKDLVTLMCEKYRNAFPINQKGPKIGPVCTARGKGGVTS